MQIKKCSGIKRAKTDKTDSREIAVYAWRYEDRTSLYKISGKIISSLKLLFSYQDRLLHAKVGLLVSAKEMRQVIRRDSTARFIYEDTCHEVQRLTKKIQQVEKLMEQKLSEVSEVEVNYQLATFVKGIGMINAVAIQKKKIRVWLTLSGELRLGNVTLVQMCFFLLSFSTSLKNMFYNC